MASLAPASFEEARRLAARVPREADAIEYRLDFAPGRISARALLDLDPRCAIVTYRTTREGGKFSGTAEEYRRSVQSAYDAGAVVDVEFESGLLGDEAFLPDRTRVIGSRHGAALSEARLRACLGHRVAAAKLVLTDPDNVAEAVACIARARRLSRETLIACFATGARGAVSRAVGLRYGGALTYGNVAEETAPGQIPVAELVEVYGARDRTPPERLFAVYGGDVTRSLSPAIHNAIFRRRGLPWLYLPLTASRPGAPRESPIAADLIALDGLAKNLQGVSVTNPFKTDYASVARADAQSERIGAANTFVRLRPECLDLSAHNTDAAAVRQGLERLGGSRVLVLGTGGAARAAVAAAVGFGKECVVAGRAPGKAAAIAAAFGIASMRIEDVDQARPDVSINATPLGASDGDRLPFPADALGPGRSIIDFVYRRGAETALVREARERGAKVVDGLEILARQAAGQAALFGVRDATFEEIDATLRSRP